MSIAFKPFFASQLEKINDYVPSVVVGSNYLVLYDKYTGDRRKKKLPLSNINNRIVSSAQASKIRYYTNLLIDCSKSKKVYSAESRKWYSFKVNLITLTLPSKQIHTDKVIHEKVFKEFIRAWKRSSKELLYIYKAEVQDNGNLHYHLTTNTYIDYRELRNKWNYYCEKLGYVTRSGIASPNSTDVHSVKSVKNLASYMVSYLSKKDLYSKALKRYHARYNKILKKMPGNECKLPRNYFSNIKRKVELKVWDCSKPLMLGKCSLEIDSQELMDDVRRALQLNTAPIVKDWCIVLENGKEVRKGLKTISKVYSSHIAKLREFVKSQPAEYYAP